MLTAHTNHSAPDAAPACSLVAATTFCKASADRLRLLILRALRHDSMAVSELCHLFAIRQPAMSHHLKTLAEAGLVATRREGNTIFYRRTSNPPESGLAAMHKGLLDTVDTLDLGDHENTRMREIHQSRAALSRQFFQDNADKFKAQQDLIANYEQYADTVAQTLRDHLSESRDAVEIGPGDGRFLSILSPLFDRVVAIDNASEMLESSRRLADSQDLTNIEFILGDTKHPSLQDASADCVIANMVLHHTPSPADILMDVAQALRPGGIFILTDLCLHDQGWARESCGDLWLGFDEADLSAWATAAGLTTNNTTYLTQRNGFRVQILVFQRTN